MAKPEWGSKRICLSCGARFYDLGKRPIMCPACGTEFEEEAFQRGRRGRVQLPEEAVEPVVAVEAPRAPAEQADEEADEAQVGDELPEVDVGVDVEEEEEDTLIEDASELGEDDDDMAEVIENVDSEKER